jgi:hypothetical protein
MFYLKKNKSKKVIDSNLLRSFFNITIDAEKRKFTKIDLSDDEIEESTVPSTDDIETTSVPSTVVDGSVDEIEDFDDDRTEILFDNESVPETVFDKEFLSDVNYNILDKNINMEDVEEHTYSIKGFNYPVISVTQLIKIFFKPFDSDAISLYLTKIPHRRTSEYYRKSKEEILDLWKFKRNTGIKVHSLIYNYYENMLNDELRVNWSNIDDSLRYNGYIQAFNKYNIKMKTAGWIPYRSEYMIYNKITGIAGTVDMLYINGKKEFLLVDWKVTDKKIQALKRDNGQESTDVLNQLKETNIKSFFRTKQSLYNSIKNTRFGSYSLALAMYSILLREYYNIRINKMSLILLRNDGNFEVANVDQVKYVGLASNIMNYRKEFLINQNLINIRNLKSFDVNQKLSAEEMYYTNF